MSHELLEELKRISVAMGYRFEVDADGTERMIRPDGTVAVTARRRVEENNVTRLRRERRARYECYDCSQPLSPDDLKHEHRRCQPCRVYVAALQQRRRKL